MAASSAPSSIRLRRLRTLLCAAGALACAASGAPAPARAQPLLFAPGSVWNARLAPGAPLDTRSAAYVSDLQRQVRGWGGWINTSSYSTPLYTVARDQPTVRV